MKQIPLSNGTFAIVDDDDYDEVMKYSWCEKKGRNTIYAATSFEMHRVVMGRDKCNGFVVDHINGNGYRESVTIGYYGVRNKILNGNKADYQLLCANCNWIKRVENSEIGGRKRDRVNQLIEK